MLHPSMNQLLEKVNNRYLLVNIAAKRARDIALQAEMDEYSLTEKPVKMALNDIYNGRIAIAEPRDEQDEDFAPADLQELMQDDEQETESEESLEQD